MHSTTLKKALVVASVALAISVLGAGSAHADAGDGGHGKDGNGSSPRATSTSSAHGKARETDKSGSSSNPQGTFQGRSRSTPDQDGTGTDRGADNNDKTGPGTDGNNGCGNEPRLAAPRDGGRPTDDDSNGWCGAKPKPARTSPAAQKPVPVTATPAVTETRTPSSPVETSRQGEVPASGSGVVAMGSGTHVVGRTTTSAAVESPALTLGSGSVSGSGPAALPRTGAPLDLLLVLSLLTVAAGTAVTRLGSRRAS